MMRSAFVALATAAVFVLPGVARAVDGDDDDRDRHGDHDRDRHHGDRDRDHHDRDRDRHHGGRDRDHHDRDRDHHGDRDHHDNDRHHHDDFCPDDFDAVLSFIDFDSDDDGDGVICCKRIDHGDRDGVVCIDRDFDDDWHRHRYHERYDFGD